MIERLHIGALTELTSEVNMRISNTISRSTVGRILQNADIRPHKSRYWLTPNIKDDPTPKTMDSTSNGLLQTLAIGVTPQSTQ